MVKAIFLDIDGTLVSFETHKIPQSTIDALIEVKRKGVKIFIATGRPEVFINNLSDLQNIDLIDGYVTMNGSYCKVGEEVIFKKMLDRGDILQVAAYCDENEIPLVTVKEHTARIYKSNKLFREIFYDMLHVGEIEVAETLEEALEGEIFQITPFIAEGDAQEILENLKDSEIGRWHSTFTDICAKGNTKQNGIDQIIAHFGIKLEETMAFGDGGNDISMLKHAAIGVAMGNASDYVKSFADHVTTSVDEGGVAEALHYFNVI